MPRPEGGGSSKKVKVTRLSSLRIIQDSRITRWSRLEVIQSKWVKVTRWSSFNSPLPSFFHNLTYNSRLMDDAYMTWHNPPVQRKSTESLKLCLNAGSNPEFPTNPPPTPFTAPPILDTRME